MPKSKKTPESELDSAFVNLTPVPDFPETQAEKGVASEVKDIPIKERPPMWSPAWSDYVLGHFQDSEFFDGRPNVAGLRRVTEELLGPITRSEGKVRLVTASVVKSDGIVISRNYWVGTHTVEIRFEDDEEKAYDTRVFTEVANKNSSNMESEFLSQWGPESASTAAESRALRKALKLQGVISAEETTPEGLKDPEGGGEEDPEKITKTLINTLRILADRNKIDLMKYINYDFLNKVVGDRFKTIEEVDYVDAKKMFIFLSECQRDNMKIPELVKKEK